MLALRFGHKNQRLFFMWFRKKMSRREVYQLAVLLDKNHKEGQLSPKEIKKLVKLLNKAEDIQRCLKKSQTSAKP